MATSQILEREIQYLQRDRDAIAEERDKWRQKRVVFEVRINAYGGRDYTPPKILNDLRDTLKRLDFLEQKFAEIDSNLVEKQAEKDRLAEIEELREEFESALKNKYPQIANGRAAILKSLAPQLAEFVDSGLTRLNWIIASEAKNYKDRLKALEWLETNCYKRKDEVGFQTACERIAQLSEERAEEEIEIPDLRLAVHFLRRAYDRYTSIDDIVSKSRVRNKLDIIHPLLSAKLMLL